MKNGHLQALQFLLASLELARCGQTFYIPDHPFKQVVNDEVRLCHHNQQSHVSPPKLMKTEKKEDGYDTDCFARLDPNQV